MMKNKNLKYIYGLLIAILFFGCQEMDRPEFSDFPYDGPIVTLKSPSPGGSTVVRSPDPLASITIVFDVEDDLGIASIIVQIDDEEILNMSTFSNDRMVSIDDLTYDSLTTGVHTLTLTVTDINDVVVTETAIFEKQDTLPYTPLDGELFYMPFDGDYGEAISGSGATEIGTPGFTANAKVGTNAYAGADDAYLTFPTDGLLGDEISASFWYNLNNPGTNRAGILVIGPPDTSNPDNQNNRNSGFRLFREGGDDQSIRLNVGNGSGNATAIAARRLNNDSGWVHLAFTVTQTKAKIYMDGVLEIERDITGLDWTGCDIMSIMSGAPRFVGWNHNSDLSSMDELKLFNKELTQSDVSKLVANGSKIFNMPFNAGYTDTISETDATVEGSPSLTTDAKEGDNAYAGADDAYLTFPTDGLLGDEVSATFWYNLNNPGTNRAGILVIGPPDTSNPDNQNNRNSGFRLFREGGDDQSIRLNVGNGTGNATAIAARRLNNDSGWVHLAFTISQTKALIYMDGVLEIERDITGLDWTGCDIMSIMSGAPRFVGWNHKSDLSKMDALALYNKVLSQEEIQAIMN